MMKKKMVIMMILIIIRLKINNNYDNIDNEYII